MKIDLSDKFFWFVFVELLLGVAASILSTAGTSKLTVAQNQPPTSDSRNLGDKITWLAANIFAPGALAPLVLRSNLYFHEKELGKWEMIALLVSTFVYYLVGGIVFVVLKYTLRAVLCIAAGGVLIADLICTLI